MANPAFAGRSFLPQANKRRRKAQQGKLAKKLGAVFCFQKTFGATPADNDRRVDRYGSARHDVHFRWGRAAVAVGCPLDYELFFGTGWGHQVQR